MQLDPGDVAMVGDDPEDDVAGALAAGLADFQVKMGKYRPETVAEGGTPLESVAELPEVLGI